jgi:ATP-binding cassette, subfamily C, bacterial
MMIKAALVMLAARQVGYTAANVATDLRLGLIRNLMKAKWEYFINQPMGNLSNAIATEAERTSVAYVPICRILADAIQAETFAQPAENCHIRSYGRDKTNPSWPLSSRHKEG